MRVASRLVVGGVDIPDRRAQRRLVLRLQHHIHHLQPRAAANSLWYDSPRLWVGAGEEPAAYRVRDTLRSGPLLCKHAASAQATGLSSQAVWGHACCVQALLTNSLRRAARPIVEDTSKAEQLTHSLANADLHRGPLVVGVGEGQRRLWPCCYRGGRLRRTRSEVALLGYLTSSRKHAQHAARTCRVFGAENAAGVRRSACPRNTCGASELFSALSLFAEHGRVLRVLARTRLLQEHSSSALLLPMCASGRIPRAPSMVGGHLYAANCTMHTRYSRRNQPNSPT